MAANPSAKSAVRFDGPTLIPLGHHAGKPPIQLHRPVIVIGSRSTARIHLMSSTISKAHALLVQSNGKAYIRDLASRSHVYVNGEEIRELELSDGDLIKLGSFTFQYSEGSRRPTSPPKSLPPAELDVTGGDFPVPMDERVVLIGRRPTVDIPLLEESASTAHAVVFEMNGDRYVRDLGSRTGTFVNGVSTHQHKLSPGDVIRVGETDIRYTPTTEAPQIDVASSAESAAAYALEAPTEELEAEPATTDKENETMGGLDLMGEVVARATAPYAEKRQPQKPPAPIEPDSLEVLEPAENAVPREPSQKQPASADMPVPVDELPDRAQAEVEKLRPAPAPAETTGRGSPPQASSLSTEEDLAPRRGWRTALPHEEPESIPSEPVPLESGSVEPEPVEPEPAQSSVIESAPVESLPAESAPAEHEFVETEFLEMQAVEAAPEDSTPVELQQPPPPPPKFPEPRAEEMPPLIAADQESTEVLRFEEPVRTDDSVLDQDSLSPQLPLLEPEDVPAKPEAELPPLELRLDSPAEMPPAREPSREPPIDFSIDFPQRPREPEPEPLELDLHEERAEQPPVPLVNLTEKPKERPLIEPLLAPDAVSTPVEPPRPPLHTPAPQIAKANEPAHPALEESEEVLDHTEPTPESALDLDRATGNVTFDESAVADALAEPADSMTDSMLNRAVEELSGGGSGDIVEEEEPQSAEQSAAPRADSAPPSSVKNDEDRFASMVEMDLPALDEAQSILPTEPAPPQPQPVAEAPPPPPEPPRAPQAPEPPEAPKAEQTPQAPPAPAQPQKAIPRPNLFQIGANQENFLGGIPLPRPKLPPRRPMADPVDELIAEIDSAAAAADRARGPESPFAPDVPPRPRRARGPTQGEPSATAPSMPRALDETIPPFTSNTDPTEGHVTLGFDGLAMPPVRQTDVFAQMSPPPQDDDALAGASGVMTPMDMVEAPESSRRRGRALTGEFNAPPDTFMGGTGQAAVDQSDLDRSSVRPALGAFEASVRQPPVMYAPDDSELAAADQHRKLRRRIPVLFGLMFALIVGAVASVYGLVPVKSSIDASLTFRNLEARSKRDRDQFQEQQRRLLNADTTRKDARSRLLTLDSEISPGFLSDQLEYLKIVDRAFWPETRKNALVISHQGAASDATRLKTLMLTLFDANKLLLDSAASYKRSLQTVQDEIARNERRLSELKTDKESLRIKGEQAPTPQQMRDLEADVSRLLSAWNTAIAASKNAEADLARMKQSGATAVGAEKAPAIIDVELANMQKELDQLTAKADAQREANSAKAEEARKSLDDAMQNFQTEIAAASEMNNGNPELTAYVAAAQKLQETTRHLIDELIRRQEQQFSSLMELKERLNDKMEARRNDMWQADKELQQLTEQLAILTRQYNAAVGGGLKKEADDLSTQIELTKNLVKARQDLIPGDAFYAEAIQQIQLIIDSTKKNIDEDRAKTDQVVEQLQRSFTASPPAIEKLPAEQKDLAAQLQKKLAAINEARKQYNAAVDAGVADIEPGLKQQLATLTAGIEARRKQLADATAREIQGKQQQDHLANIAVKQAELDQLKKSEQAAETAYLARNKDLRDAQLALTEAKANSEKLNDVINQQGLVEVQLKALNDQLEAKQRDAATAIEPLRPGENDIITRDGVDRRPIYAGASSLIILVAFSFMILWTWHNASREAPYIPLAAADLNSANPSGSNGQDAGPKANGRPQDGSEEERHPAVV